MTQPDPHVLKASHERIATEKEIQAAIMAFEACLYRDDAGRLARATDAAHAALQNHLDAIAGQLAVVKRSIGL